VTVFVIAWCCAAGWILRSLDCELLLIEGVVLMGFALSREFHGFAGFFPLVSAVAGAVLFGLLMRWISTNVREPQLRVFSWNLLITAIVWGAPLGVHVWGTSAELSLVLVVLGLAGLALVFGILRRSGLGPLVRSAGRAPELLSRLGLDPWAIHTAAFVMACIMLGLAGAVSGASGRAPVGVGYLCALLVSLSSLAHARFAAALVVAVIVLEAVSPLPPCIGGALLVGALVWAKSLWNARTGPYGDLFDNTGP